jgi:hypothetical protein
MADPSCREPSGRRAVTWPRVAETSSAVLPGSAKGGPKVTCSIQLKGHADADPASALRAESKGAKILALIGRPKEATLAEIVKAPDWQKRLKIESTKTEAGDRAYQIRK